MGLTQINLLMVYSIAVIFVVAVTYVSGDDIILQKRLERSTPELGDPIPQKRPFCNAFTGCGKKRSDDSLSTFVELHSEPAVEELTKQIMSEAKLWEAIQEAKAERERRQREKQNFLANSLQYGYPISSFRRKRSTFFKENNLNRMSDQFSER